MEGSILQEMMQNSNTDIALMLKYIGVFIAFVVGFIIMFPIYKKVSYAISEERKRDIAVSRNHIIKAKRIKNHTTGFRGDYTSHGTYTYELDGKEKKYEAIFNNREKAPVIVNLLYVDNPKKVFCYEAQHWRGCKWIVMIPIFAIPWIFGMIAVVALKLYIPGV